MSKTFSGVPGDSRCECSDINCNSNHNGKPKCDETATTILYRVDMVDVTGTAFCEACAEDASLSGLFTDSTEDDDELLTWYGSLSGLTLEMTLEQAESVSHQGQCDEDVKALMRVPAIASQLEKMPDDCIIRELRETSAWDVSEMLDRETNLRRIVWLAGCDIKEENRG